eukprot:scaffold47023_cov17-Tisochrysis_lutea.AAC.1
MELRRMCHVWLLAKGGSEPCPRNFGAMTNVFQVTFLESATVLPSIAHPGIPEEGMPQLCFVEMTMDIQVGLSYLPFHLLCTFLWYYPAGEDAAGLHSHSHTKHPKRDSLSQSGMCGIKDKCNGLGPALRHSCLHGTQPITLACVKTRTIAMSLVKHYNTLLCMELSLSWFSLPPRSVVLQRKRATRRDLRVLSRWTSGVLAGKDGGLASEAVWHFQSISFALPEHQAFKKLLLVAPEQFYSCVHSSIAWHLPFVQPAQLHCTLDVWRRVQWNSMYRDTPFSLHPGTVYQVQQGEGTACAVKSRGCVHVQQKAWQCARQQAGPVGAPKYPDPRSTALAPYLACRLDHAGLFSSLIVFELRHPEGSDPSGPSPFCSSLTPAADTEVARLRHTAGQISNTESA